jgi:ATP/maltotriose-dependent transcriptional regulator MalT
MRERLEATPEPESEADILAELLADDLHDWPEEAWLGLDDYQLATTSPVAERFVDTIASSAHVRLLIASRQRPLWATARRLLYGEIYELGQDALVMDQEEAHLVLRGYPAKSGSGLVALAQGYPAVIGLVAMSNETAFPEERVPSALYEYFADELFQNATEEVRRALCEMSVVPSLDAAIVSALFKDRAEILVAEAVNLGFLTQATPEAYELHPLLRVFLEGKLRGADKQALHRAVHAAGSALIQLRRWDDAFELVERHLADPLLLDLFSHGVEQMLREGRPATITRWVAHARERGLDSPLIDLADAEVAF